MAEFNSDDHYIYYYGQESLRRNGVACIVYKGIQMQYLGAISKTIEWSVCFQGKPLNITVIQVCAPTTDAKEAEFDQFYEDLQELLELTPKKDIPFIIGDWNVKVGCQEIPGITGKFGLGVLNETGQKLIEFCQENTGHSKYPFPTTQEMILHMGNTKWSIPISDWLYSLQLKIEKLYTVNNNKKRPGADCGSDHELLIAKFKFK